MERLPSSDFEIKKLNGPKAVENAYSVYYRSPELSLKEYKIQSKSVAESLAKIFSLNRRTVGFLFGATVKTNMRGNSTLRVEGLPFALVRELLNEIGRVSVRSSE